MNSPGNRISSSRDREFIHQYNIHQRTIKDVDWTKEQVTEGTLARAVELFRSKLCPEISSVKTETPSVFEIHSGTAKVVIY